jgi:hypothetical protein
MHSLSEQQGQNHDDEGDQSPTHALGFTAVQPPPSREPARRAPLSASAGVSARHGPPDSRRRSTHDPSSCPLIERVYAVLFPGPGTRNTISAGVGTHRHLEAGSFSSSRVSSSRPEDRRVRPSQARNTSARPRSARSARLRRAGYVHLPLRVEVIDVVRNLQARCASDQEKAPSATREHDRVQPPTLNLYAQRREGGLESPTQYPLSDQNLISRERPRLDSHRRSLRAAGQS